MPPRDPCILLSYGNTKLRDQYPSQESLYQTLAGLDYRYDPVYNQFI